MKKPPKIKTSPPRAAGPKLVTLSPALTGRCA